MVYLPYGKGERRIYANDRRGITPASPGARMESVYSQAGRKRIFLRSEVAIRGNLHLFAIQLASDNTGARSGENPESLWTTLKLLVASRPAGWLLTSHDDYRRSIESRHVHCSMLPDVLQERAGRRVWFRMEEKERLPVLQTIYHAIAEITSAEQHVIHAKADLEASVMLLPSLIGDDTMLRDQVIWQLYWKLERVQKAWIKKAFSLKDTQLNAIISKAWLTISCPVCKQQRRVQISSKSAISRYDSSYYTTCDACKEAESKRVEESNRAYAEARNTHLEELHTMPYYDYLKTPEWDARRKRSLRKAGYCCQVCNAKGVRLNVHHRTYERRGYEDDRDLIVLCADCHTIFHENGSLADSEA